MRNCCCRKLASRCAGWKPYEDDERPVNVFDAAAQGASSGLMLALNVGAMLLAFIGLIAVINLGVSSLNDSWSLEKLFGFLFAPAAWLLGIPWQEATQGGSLIGTKLVANEFVAFSQLEVMQEADPISKPEPRHHDFRPLRIRELFFNRHPFGRARGFGSQAPTRNRTTGNVRRFCGHLFQFDERGHCGFVFVVGSGREFSPLGIAELQGMGFICPWERCCAFYF